MAEEQETAEEKTAKTAEPKAGFGRDDVVETVIGLAVLGLGAAAVAGSMSLGGVLRGLTRGVPPRTPPIGPQ
ncbi:MAG: hypothetical protein HOV87_36135 [Catenulispora sp.]|nr:hypothetical protein [Catenulispora sp.]